MTSGSPVRTWPFFAAVFLLAWAWWLGVSKMVDTASVGAGAVGLLFLPGTFAPAIVAVVLAARSGGAKSVRALLSRLTDRGAGMRWYVFAISYMAAVKLAAAAAHRVITGAWPAFGATPAYVMLAAVAVSTPVQGGEEIGWRGFALPRLAQRFGLGGASVILGVIWAIWHLPLFLIAGTDTTDQSFPVFLFQVTALSVAMAWLFARARGSLLPVMLMHAAVNNTKDIVPSAEAVAPGAWALSRSLVAWSTVSLLWLCAVFFLFRMRRSPELEGAVEEARWFASI